MSLTHWQEATHQLQKENRALTARVAELEAERHNITKGERHSDFQVIVTFTSCRAAGEFADALLAKGK